MSDETDVRETAPTFEALALSPAVRRALDELGFTTPTAVQRAAFAPAASGQDLIVQSRTGTGKTLGFGLPLVDRLVEEGHGVQALILAPTRELALQSQRVLEQVGKYRHLRTVAVYGGAPMERQIQQLKQGAEIVSGTPGRVLDHLRRGTLDAAGIRVLVLDEADEMFSMGFAKELNAIMDALPDDRQFLCFSATIDDNVQRMAERRMRSPEFITLSSDQVGASEISHYFYMVLGDKLNALIRVLEVEDPESAIIFCNTKNETETVARHLSAAGFNADWLNGDLPQRDREQIMKATREGQLRYMVATDVAARGIDISHLTHVINFGFPESAEQYVHRTGRTGRAGRTGTAISVLGPSNLGALYYLRLTFKIFPIERSIPSATELKTRKETDRLSLLTEAFKGAPLDENRDVVRRLLTHPDAERILGGLVRSFFSGVTFDVDEAAAAARRDRPNPPSPAPAKAQGSAEEEDAEEDVAAESPGKRKRKRRRGGRSDGAVAAEDTAPEPAPEEPDSSPDLAEEPPPVPEDMTTLYFNVGKRDGLEPRDLSSLLVASCGLTAEDIGRVRVKDRHTFVGVPTERADAVISSLQGQSIKNRALQVERART
jgi:ATP-dependent RNA helicase DeaD